MISVATKELFAFHIPAMLLVQPVSTKKLPDAGIVWFLLWGLEGHELVEVLIDEGRFTGASTGGVWRAVPISLQIG